MRNNQTETFLKTIPDLMLKNTQTHLEYLAPTHTHTNTDLLSYKLFIGQSNSNPSSDILELSVYVAVNKCV